MTRKVDISVVNWAALCEKVPNVLSRWHRLLPKKKNNNNKTIKKKNNDKK